MCRPVLCKDCGKTTWAGCGMHVDQVMAGVAEAQRCGGHGYASGAERGGHAREPRPGGLMARLLGR